MIALPDLLFAANLCSLPYFWLFGLRSPPCLPALGPTRQASAHVRFLPRLAAPGPARSSRGLHTMAYRLLMAYDHVTHRGARTPGWRSIRWHLQGRTAWRNWAMRDADGDQFMTSRTGLRPGCIR
jgi:hypothetical protein